MTLKELQPCAKFLWTLAIVLTIAGWHAGSLHAAVKPHGLFQDNMVLQQNVKLPVWGKADQNGYWKLYLAPQSAGGPYELVIAGSNRITLKNVMIGKVWVCSGQSNMEWTLGMSRPEKSHQPVEQSKPAAVLGGQESRGNADGRPENAAPACR